MAAKIRTFMSTNPPIVPPIEVSQHTNAHCKINICVFSGFFNTVGGFAFTFTSQSYTVCLIPMLSPISLTRTAETTLNQSISLHESIHIRKYHIRLCLVWPGY